jgi:hypothetical protein
MNDKPSKSLPTAVPAPDDESTMYNQPYPVFVGPEAKQFQINLPRHAFYMCLEADALEAVGLCLCDIGEPDDRMCAALADKIVPPNDRMARWEWRARRGRPRRRSTNSEDPLGSALATGDLKVIADHLRAPASPDRQRVVSWLLEQLDCKSQFASHFVVKRPQRRGVKPNELTAARMRIGQIVDREFRRHGKLEAALQYVMTKSEEVPHPMTRSAARRAYDLYKDRTVSKNLTVLVD